MTINYVGQSEYGKEDRFAVIDAKKSEEDTIVDILNVILEGSSNCYDIYGFGEDIVVYVQVDDKADFKSFAKAFRKARKERC